MKAFKGCSILVFEIFILPLGELAAVKDKHPDGKSHKSERKDEESDVVNNLKCCIPTNLVALLLIDKIELGSNCNVDAAFD